MVCALAAPVKATRVHERAAPRDWGWRPAPRLLCLPPPDRLLRRYRDGPSATHRIALHRPARRPRGSRLRLARARGAGGHDDHRRARDARLALARSGRHRGADHAVHGALRDPRRPREADAGRPQYAEPGGVVVGVEGRHHLRVRHQKGRPLPHRRRRDRGRRQVLLRALPRQRQQAPEGEGEGDPDRGSEPRPLRAEGAVAGLHGDLWHLRDRRGLDRPEEVHREGRRGGLQEVPRSAQARSSSSPSIPAWSWCSRPSPTTGARHLPSSAS